MRFGAILHGRGGVLGGWGAALLLLRAFFSEPFCTLGAGFWGVGGGGDDNVHVIAFGEHTQNTGIYGTSASTCYFARQLARLGIGRLGVVGKRPT